ncbi:biotin/lipoyl-binding carrier protein [Streptomyces sp. CA-106131]|uniref:biotin/lipoyl-binding carrier protein n=1 Tax=Streptomyces sp. CA-106131 TaxID=3240045 RepID=UPI003D912532
MSHTILAEMVATVWKVVAKPGDVVGPDDTLVILESMKMEIPIAAEVAGTISEIAVAEGDSIDEGGKIAVISINPGVASPN